MKFEILFTFLLAITILTIVRYSERFFHAKNVKIESFDESGLFDYLKLVLVELRWIYKIVQNHHQWTSQLSLIPSFETSAPLSSSAKFVLPEWMRKSDLDLSGLTNFNSSIVLKSMDNIDRSNSLPILVSYADSFEKNWSTEKQIRFKNPERMSPNHHLCNVDPWNRLSGLFLHENIRKYDCYFSGHSIGLSSWISWRFIDRSSANEENMIKLGISGLSALKKLNLGNDADYIQSKHLHQFAFELNMLIHMKYRSRMPRFRILIIYGSNEEYMDIILKKSVVSDIELSFDYNDFDSMNTLITLNLLSMQTRNSKSSFEFSKAVTSAILCSSKDCRFSEETKHVHTIQDGLWRGIVISDPFQSFGSVLEIFEFAEKVSKARKPQKIGSRLKMKKFMRPKLNLAT